VVTITSTGPNTGDWTRTTDGQANGSGTTR
jgi:hypothetical protein